MSAGITAFASRAPYPEWQAIQFLNGDAIANYNALSAKLTQRFGRNLTTLFSFTWSKAMDEGSGIRGTRWDRPPSPYLKYRYRGATGSVQAKRGFAGLKSMVDPVLVAQL